MACAWVLGMLNLIVPVCAEELARLRGLVSVQQWAFGSSCSSVWVSLWGLLGFFWFSKGCSGLWSSLWSLEGFRLFRV